jgi:hypothetical protein
VAPRRYGGDCPRLFRRYGALSTELNPEIASLQSSGAGLSSLTCASESCLFPHTVDSARIKAPFSYSFDLFWFRSPLRFFRFYTDKSVQTGSYLVVGQGRVNSTAPWLVTAGDSQGHGLKAPQASSKIVPTVSLLRLGVDFKDLQSRPFRFHRLGSFLKITFRELCRFPTASATE